MGCQSLFQGIFPTQGSIHVSCLAAAAAKSLQSCPTLCDPTRLPRPWDSPGKDSGVACHFLLQCMQVKSESEVTQLCLALSNSMDCSLPGSSVHGIFQARVQEWVAIPSSRGSSGPRDRIHVSCMAGRDLTSIRIIWKASASTDACTCMWRL